MFKYNYLLALVTIVLIVTTTNRSFAGIIDWSNSIQTTSGGTAVQIGQPEAIDSVAATIPGTTYSDVNVLNRITLGVDFHYAEFFGSAMDVQVTVKVKRWDVSMSPMADTTFDLTISYHPFDTLQTVSLNKADFYGAYKMVFSIEGIVVNGSTETILPANLFLQGDIFIERYLELSSSSVSSNKFPIDIDCDGTTDGIEVTWSAIAGAEEYQLEWAYINDYGISGPLSSTELAFDFKFNSTRITTADLSYTISLIFDKGYLIYRVRPVGVDLSDPTQFLFGNWNVVQSGMVSSVTSTNSYQITSTDQHEGDLNWQYSATYAEQGKKKEIVSYYDGSLRNRQTVTKINSDENVIVGETIYDHQGRPAINVLPTPVKDPTCNPLSSEPTIHLYRNFNLNDSLDPYSRKDFDISDTINAPCNVGAAPMDTSSGSSNYYSPSNPDQNLEQAYVPDAKKYPFTQVEYTPDNTGRIRRQSGVGEEFKLGSGHETKYLYGRPNQLELDRLFGSEVGNEKHYKKNVVIDAHGQASISYLDQEGRVIATALAGEAPSNLLAIESANAGAVQLSVNAFGDNNSLNAVSIDNNALVFSTSILVAYQSNYTFSYSFDVAPLDIACLGSLCVDCVYDLSIDVIDECGNNLAPSELQDTMIGKFTSDTLGYHFHGVCSQPQDGTFNSNFTVSLAPGSYTVSKILTVNQEALDAFVELYLNSDCAMSLADFDSIAMANIDTSGCEITCDNCFDNLGTLEDFIANGEGNANDYYLRVEDCEKLCNGTISYCEVMETLLQMDMSPGGQYGEYINTTSGAVDYGFPLSVYNSSNALPNGGYWTSPVLNTPNGTLTIYVDENGERSKVFLTPNPSVSGGWLPEPNDVNDIQIDPLTGQEFIYPEQLNNTADFIDAFLPSWGKSLIVYHPEYCYYETCLSFEDEVAENDAFTSASFDDLMAQQITFQDAQNAGFINGSGLPTNWFAPVGMDNTDATIPWDPYVYYSSNFSTSYCDDLGTKLMQRFNQYKFINGQWYSMAQVAAYTARCGSNFDPAPAAACFDFGQLYNGVLNIPILDQEWYILRSLYMSEKQKLRREYADCKAIMNCDAYNGCIGNDSFSPFPEMTVHSIGISSWYTPIIDPGQPCSIYTSLLYLNKVKRFSDEDDIPEDDANGVAYEVYLQTGQCPVPFSLQTLFSAMAMDGNIDGTAVDLNDYIQLTSLFLADNAFNIPGVIPNLEYNAVITGTNLNATWTDTDASTTFLTMSMTLGSGGVWSDVDNIYNFYATSSGTFTADALINDTTIVPITGTITHFTLDPCYFEYECSSNQLALNITSLLNTLQLNGDISSTSNVAINPYVTTYGTFSGLTNIYIENAANVGSNLYWVSISSTLYKIFDPSGNPSDGLYLNFSSALSPAFLATVSYFGPITSTGEYSFEVEAFITSGGSVILEGTLYRETQGVMLGIATGDCGLPVPAACQTAPHENFNDLESLLIDQLVTEDYDGSQQIDLYSSIAFTPNIQSSLPAGITATTSQLSTNGDTLQVFAGDCTIQLTVPLGSGANLADIIDISSFATIGTVDNYNNYHDFQFAAVFDNGTTVFSIYVFGTSCLPIKECSPCGEDANIPLSDTAMQIYLSDQVIRGKMIFDNSTAMTSGSYEEISAYMQEKFMGVQIVKKPVISVIEKVEDPDMPCSKYYDGYFDCIENFNLNSPQFPIINIMTLEQFESQGYCDCAELFCNRLDSIRTYRLNFKFEQDFLDYIDFETFCNGCEDAFQTYRDCYYQHSYHGVFGSLPPILNYEDFVELAICDCIDEYCLRLSNVDNQTVEFETQQEFEEYINFDNFCDTCARSYNDYLETVNIFNTHSRFYHIDDIISIDDFLENRWCDCIEEFNLRMDSVLNHRIAFDSDEEFQDFINFNTFCSPCAIAYENYLNCIEVYNDSKPKNKIENIIKYEDFVSNGWCDCVDEFCNRLDSILNYDIRFDSLEAFNTFIHFESFCGGCYTQYLEYVDCYYALSNLHIIYRRPPLFTYENFMDNGWCDCIGLFCDRVNSFVNQEVNLENQAEFDSYFSFAEFCDSCAMAYSQYIDCIESYNGSRPNYTVRNIVEYDEFLTNNWCNCVDEFCFLLNNIIDSNLQFEGSDEFENYINFDSFCENVSVLDPVDPCEQPYIDYLNCIAYYNSVTTTFPITYILPYETFVDRALCHCVNGFCASLDNILSGYVTFLTRGSFTVYLEQSLNCDSRPPCAPDPSTGIPVVTPEVTLVNDCIQMMINQANFEAQNNYNTYVDSLSNALVQQYMDHCLHPLETMNYSYYDKLYHFTLYYYDQAGNLIKTIPPAGVEKINITSSSDADALLIAADRMNHTKNVYTTHRLATRYEYNSLNQLVAQSTPDTDPMDQFDLTLPNGLNNKLITRKIQMIDASRGYLGGEVNGRGYLYQTTDGGATWTRVYNLVSADLKKIVMFTTSDGIAIGEKGIVLRTSNGGNSWDMLDTWSTTGTGIIHDLNDAAFIDQGGGNYDLFLVGEDKCVVFCNDILASAPTFTVLNSGIVGSNVSVSSIVSDGTTYFITVNDPTGNKANIYKFDTGTSVWVAENGFSENSFTDVQYYDNILGDKAYAAGVDGRLYKNKLVNVVGSTWLHVASNLVDPIKSIRFFSEDQGVALVQQGSSNKLYRTVDGGHLWEQISINSFNHLSISEDKSLIMAVGENGIIEVVVPSTGNSVDNIIINGPNTTSNFTAGWIDKEVNGLGNSLAHIIVANSTGTMYYSSNGFITYPVWNNSSISGNVVREIIAERGWTSNQTIYGAVTTVSGDLLRLKKESTVSTVSLLTISGTGTNDYSGLATNGQYIYTTQDQTNLVSIPMSAVTTSFTVLGALSTDVNALDLTLTRLAGVGQNGEILNITLDVPGTSIVSQSVATETTAPNKLFTIGYNATSNQYLAAGEDGILYERNSTLSVWNRRNTNFNETINDYDEENSKIYVVGTNGLSKSGTIVSNDFVSQNFLNSASVPTSNVLAGYNLNAVRVYSDKLYAVGDNGKVIFNANVTSLPYAVLTQGSKNLYDVDFNSGVNGVLSVGESATIISHSTTSFLLKKEVFTPPVIDLNFSNNLSGTVLCNNFVVRTTSSGGNDWNVIRPNTDQAPTYAYTKVWNKNATTSYLFGNTTQYKITNEIASPYTISGYTLNAVRTVDQGSDATILHLVNNEDVALLDLTTNAATNIASLGSGALANDIHVFKDGAYLVVGDNGLYKHFDAADAPVLPLPSMSFSGINLNAIAFKDNINGVLVGDAGAYYFTTAQSVSTSGYLTTTDWLARNVIAEDPLTGSFTNANIYTISFGSSTNGVMGGEYVPTATLSRPYVRAIYDAGMRYSARFYYDKLGRLIVSQNARQFNLTDKKYSYTLYDALGRVVEVGEKTENATAGNFSSIFGTMVSNYFNPKVIDDANLSAWINGDGERREVTKSYYDETVIAGLPPIMATDLATQRKRIVHVTYEALYDGDDQTYDHATHYKYDIHGNVKTMLQDNRKMAEEFPSLASQQFKRMDYSYDLVSGNVHRMSVQDGDADQWHHAYKYDADNRIVDAYTSTATPLVAITALPQDMENELEPNSDWQKDASYYYYDHGPLARTEIGQNQLQGVDYVYNLQGWLKGVNSSVLDQDKDPGLDSKAGTTNQFFAKDVMGFGLHYYTGDYQSINGTGQNHLAMVKTTSNAANSSHDLYNGNIRYMQTAITDPTTHTAMPMLNAYYYDQLNRLMGSRSYETGLSSNEWNPTSYSDEYSNRFIYDAMGNITTQLRANRNGTFLDELSYKYQYDGNGKLLRNRLYSMNDAVTNTAFTDDIDDMGTFISSANLINGSNNYVYDEEGRLIKDAQEEIDQIVWRVDGKVSKIIRPTSSQKKNVSFDYDAMGNRIAKHVMDPSTLILEKSTYYILDAQGNTMSTYDHIVDNSNTLYTLKERQIYGSSRLGMNTAEVGMFNPEPLPSSGVLGLRYYELSNHLGNVLAVINDEIMPLDDDLNTFTDGYQVGIVNVSDYSPFGVQLDGRTISNGSYRYGFQGMEGDSEIKGQGNSYDFGARMYDPRIGRWLKTDNVIQPERSPYSGMHNNPILLIDPDGNDVIIGTWKKEDRDKFVTHLVGITGLDLYIDNNNKLQVRYGREDFVRPREYNDVQISSIAASAILSDINDHCLELVVSGARGQGSHTDAGYIAEGEGADPWHAEINLDPRESELFVGGWNLGAQNRKTGELTRDLAGTTGMKYFHERDHAVNSSLDEWDMGSPGVDADKFGDERSASGILFGSAATFENAILQEMGLFIRATYSITFGGDKIIPYLRPSQDAKIILDRFKSAGVDSKFPQTINYTRITPDKPIENDTDRDYKEYPKED